MKQLCIPGSWLSQGTSLKGSLKCGLEEIDLVLNPDWIVAPQKQESSSVERLRLQTKEVRKNPCAQSLSQWPAVSLILEMGKLKLHQSWVYFSDEEKRAKLACVRSYLRMLS